MTFDNDNWKARVVFDSNFGGLPMWACERCGVFVMEGLRDRHDEFHQRAPFDGE